MEHEEDIKKLKIHLLTDIPDIGRVREMDLLRFYLDKNTNEKDKVIYNKKNDCLDVCEAIDVSKKLVDLIPAMVSKAPFVEQVEMIATMKNNYYYLAKYLFSYYAVAIEFGIPKEKQFLDPRQNVLGYICKTLEKFYYKPKGILTISMPQGTGKTEIGKRFMSFCIGKEPDLPNMMISYSASIAKDKFYNGIITLIEDENGNFQKIFPDLVNVYKNAENMSLDYRNDGKKRPHSEYALYCAGFDGRHNW